MIDVVFLDMDGVVQDFVGAALDAHGSDLTPDDITRYNMAEIMGLSDEEFWVPIDAAGSEFWRTLPEYPWFRPLLANLKRAAKKVVFCTATSGHVHEATGKRQWLTDRYGRHDHDWIMIRHKHYLAGTPRSVLIDDSPYNVEAFRQAGGCAVLFPQSWNVAEVPDGTDIVSCVVEQAEAMIRSDVAIKNIETPHFYRTDGLIKALEIVERSSSLSEAKARINELGSKWHRED
jgi:5'(3')-deoxyribonucleotidase